MADMDLDELLDGPSQVPNRPSRFAPKGSKFKPRPKTEPSQLPPPAASDTVEGLPVPKKEEPGIKPDIKPEFANDGNDMDVEVKPEVKEEEGDDLMETEAEAEPDDAIVREIDVYFTPSIDSNTRLYVLQYPLRPLWRPYELDDRCDEVRVKPASAELEVDLAVDVDSKNYDSGADPRVQMKKQILTSSWKPPHASGYAVGILTGNKLHLNPVHAVVQLRPSMQHLDAKDSKRKTINVEDRVKLEEPQEGKPSGSSKKLSKVPEQNNDSGEGWIPLKYHSAKSDVAAGYLRKMMSRGGSQIYFSMSSCDYLNSLCPGTSSDSFSSKGPPRRVLLTLPLKERFRTWLLEGPRVHRFDALKYLAPDESVEEILGVIQEHARLVQGLWVPKSSLVYGTDQGVEVLARDYVLLLFSKNIIINNSQLPQRPQLSKAMKEVLNVLAVERPAFSDWKLKELPDISFIKRNPSIVQKQEEEWECLEKKINDLLFGGRNGPGVKTSSKSNTTNNPAAPKSSNRVATRAPNGAPSKTAMPEEVREAVTKALQKLFKSIKVCSFQQISQRLRDMAVSESKRSTGFAREAVAAANSIDAFPDELQAIISQVAVNIHGICVPKSSPDNPQYDPFRKIVIDLFLAEGPNAKLKKAPILEAAKMELKRDISPIEYQKVLQELCLSQGSAWVLRSADGNP
ncbi:DNA-directed RNA polymerase III subunit RPC5 [Sesamum indicum]|uniref:DNA-directed RNA polymerase III subunit RPC5 n=1 Tax=Sesamum indicum TaxID=4182 RepID=A0A6I9UED6_SESIN|nr:DNA-directed RNA polymerase III subunit RPC5 [Sesamum indicum]